uniref:Uncharacterized protein n=1 Tax=Knipowitschia caucasica TaxID=637954 RepID=A0AAV2K5N2_KNICA
MQLKERCQVHGWRAPKWKDVCGWDDGIVGWSKLDTRDKCVLGWWERLCPRSVQPWPRRCETGGRELSVVLKRQQQSIHHAPAAAIGSRREIKTHEKNGGRKYQGES